MLPLLPAPLQLLLPCIYLKPLLLLLHIKVKVVVHVHLMLTQNSPNHCNHVLLLLIVMVLHLLLVLGWPVLHQALVLCWSLIHLNEWAMLLSFLLLLLPRHFHCKLWPAIRLLLLSCSPSLLVHALILSHLRSIELVGIGRHLVLELHNSVPQGNSKVPPHLWLVLPWTRSPTRKGQPASMIPDKLMAHQAVQIH